MRATRVIARVLTLFVIVSIAQSKPEAQTPTGESFEVASIKPNQEGQPWTGFSVRPGGRFTATNTTVKELLSVVYQFENYRIQGGPSWLNSERYDIQAKAAVDLPALVLPAATPPLAFLMVRSLLAERFKLVVHTETKEAPIYALVMARADRKLGPQLNPNTADCAAIRAARSTAQAGPPPPPPPPSGPGERAAPCTNRGGFGHVAAGAMPLAALVTSLSRIVERPVIDRTGLTGNFDFVLDFTPDRMPQAPQGVTPPDAPPLPSVDGPSVFTALQEQLGLKLESERGPVEVLIIDHIERPTEN